MRLRVRLNVMLYLFLMRLKSVSVHASVPYSAVALMHVFAMLFLMKAGRCGNLWNSAHTAPLPIRVRASLCLRCDYRLFLLRQKPRYVVVLCDFMSSPAIRRVCAAPPLLLKMMYSVFSVFTRR
jgi:hypothetical protein